MSKPNSDKPRNEQFLDALVEELRTMSDTEALEGENAVELVQLGERLLKGAREDAGNMRMAAAKRRLSSVPEVHADKSQTSAAEARRYLLSQPAITLAARGLSELSDADVLDLFEQAKWLAGQSDAEDGKK